MSREEFIRSIEDRMNELHYKGWLHRTDEDNIERAKLEELLNFYNNKI